MVPSNSYRSALLPLSSKWIRLQLIALASLFLSACWEESTSLVFDENGGGSVEQTLLLSDRIVIGMVDDTGVVNNPTKLPTDRDALKAALGDAVEDLQIEVEELGDGGRRIHWSATFPSTEVFLASEFVRDVVGLQTKPSPSRENHLTIEWVPEGNNQNTPSEVGINQRYGLMKGLHREIKIAHSGAEAVKWTYDLRDAEGLERTRLAIEDSEKDWFMEVDAADLGVEVARLKEAIARPRTKDNRRVVEVDSESYSLKPHQLVWKKVAPLSEEVQGESSLELSLRLRWTDDEPEGYFPVVIESAYDDTGRDLLAESPSDPFRNTQFRPPHTIVVAALGAPSPEATSIASISGHLPLVAAFETEKAVLEGVHSYLDRENTGKEILDELGFNIIDISANQLIFEFSGSQHSFETVTVLNPVGERISRRSWSSQYIRDRYRFTYRFSEDIPEGADLEFIVRTGETRVNADFKFENIDLP